jgi:DNA-binding beta-propeller fold protein YncE
LTSFGSLGSGVGQFNSPRGVAVNGGLVYVADTVNSRIDRFDPSNFAGTFTSFGSQGSGVGQFFGPRGVAVDGLGDVFVADTNNIRVVQFSDTAFVSVPEPSSLTMMVLALIGMAALRQWRQANGIHVRTIAAGSVFLVVPGCSV